jgi:hypothetical protein
MTATGPSPEGVCSGHETQKSFSDARWAAATIAAGSPRSGADHDDAAGGLGEVKLRHAATGEAVYRQDQRHSADLALSDETAAHLGGLGGSSSSWLRLRGGDSGGACGMA